MPTDQKPAPATEFREEEEHNDSAKQPPTPRVTRRFFLSSLGAAGLAATAPPLLAATAVSEPAVAEQAESAAAAGAVPVTLKVNGKSYTLRLDPRTTLLDCLRENLNMPGTKKGCDHGQCGACTVHVNGQRVNSCLSFAVMHSADEITTIEGIGQPGTSSSHAGSLRGARRLPVRLLHFGSDYVGGRGAVRAGRANG